MANNTSADTSMSPTKQALIKIRELKQQLAELEGGPQEDIAIVSVACRFPRHADSPEAFWESLLEGRDEVSEVPENRWDMASYFDEDPEAPGKMYANKGVFLENLDMMDAEFFGISPREATWVDPQQRLLLEVSWEALERAGWPSDQIGEETGLFIGWMHNDYQNEASDSLLNLNPYIATGSAGSFLSGRLSYYLGLQGPSVAIDSACSSSLVAMHLACQALQRRECNRALVGGVNAILSPTTNILTCKLKALSPHGHSRAFDASADGYLRGEGCGVVALRRLSDAIDGEDPILAVIRGSAVGHNGFSSGLTAPNPKAQERVIRDALAAAKLQPSDVDYLEAHGTGTELGDPIEMSAAAAALGEGRDESSPLLTGSVKTNIGHLEAAAGMAGLIKVVLAMQNGVIPKQLGFETPNPHIAWDKLPVKVVTEPTQWPCSDQQIASVSAFGMSGTNAHVVLQSAPQRSSASQSDNSASRSGYELLTLSGKSEEAVQDYADRLARWLPSNDASVSDIAHTLRTGRRHFEQRIAIVCSTKEMATKELQLAARGGKSEATSHGSHRKTPKLAWQFTGQGAQFPKMAHDLYQNVPVFRAALDECERWMEPIRQESLLDVLLSGDDRIHHTSWTQPGMFAVEMGLAHLLTEWGIEPDFVMGHSVGQYAAACVAGFMSWEDGLRLISERGRLLGNLPEGGRMAAIFSNLDTVQEQVARHECLSIAAMNGSHIVISGRESSVDAAIAELSEAGVRCKALTTSHAFHSPLMDPALDEFEAFADTITYRVAERPLICNVTGTILAADAKLNGAYWRNHIREAVQFAGSIEALANAGCEVVLELGPRRVLTNMAASAWPGNAPTLVSCLQEGVADQEAILRAVGQLYAAGVNPDLDKFSTDQNKKTILPTYPFQRKKFWGPPKPQAQHAAVHTQHPLLGEKRSLAGVKDEVRHESAMNAERLGWIRDHQVMGEVVFPGAAYIEMALSASEASELRNAAFESPLRLTRPHRVQTVTLGADDKKVQVFAQPESSEQWTRHFSCEFADSKTEPVKVDKEQILKKCDESIASDRYYEMLGELGLQYGADFQCIRELHYGDRDVLARLELQSDLQGYTIPPMLLDQAFVSLAIGVMRDNDGSLFLPVGIESFSIQRPWNGSLWCHGQFDEPQDGKRTGNLIIFDEHGEMVARIDQLQLRELSRAAIRQMSGGGGDRLISEVSWVKKRIEAPTNSPGTWLVVSDGSFDTDSLTSGLRNENQECYQVVLNDELDPTVNGASRFAGANVNQWCELLSQFGSEDRNQLDGVIWLAPTPSSEDTEKDILAFARSQCSSLLAFLEAARRTETSKLKRGLQIVTTAGVATTPEEEVSSLVAQLWGTGRVIGAELPGLRCRLIDMDFAGNPAEELTGVVLSDSNENQIAIRDGDSLVARLQYHKATKHSGDFSVAGEGSYLITGGLGMLGRRAAAWLASRGAKHIVLVSRREPTDEVLESLRDLEESGCSIAIGQADIGNQVAAAELIGKFGDEWPELRGVIHAAGVLDDALVSEQSWERFEKVLRPKVCGAWSLHELTKSTPLDFFILYSSAASVLGSPGQSNYATGNAYLDGLAHERHSLGLPALSINWGPWDAGMADDENILKRMKLQGITPLGSDESHKAMEQLLQDGAVQATVLDADWRRLRMAQPGEPTFLEVIAPLTAGGQGQAGNTAFMKEFRAAKGKAKREILATMLQTQLQEVLSADTPPDVDTPVIDFGLDSLMAVEFSTRLQEQLGGDTAIAPTLLYDYPTISSLTEYFFEMLDSSDVEAEATAQDELAAEEQVGKDDIAIIGMSCRFPGADGVDEYWQNLLDGKDSVREIPDDRWTVDDYYSPEPAAGKMYTKEGGFLDKIADFDAEFFGISDQEACWIDPQHRLLLEVGWESLESANIVPGSLKDPSVGVFMGIMSNDYAELHNVDDIDVIDGFQGAGLAHSAGVGRVSYMFGFEGPSVAVDSASSSSLVAVCQAIKSLQDRDCNMALAGGVNAILSPSNSLLLCKAKMLSPDGRCKSFSAKADGFARGEGCGVVVLKRLRDAERDGDNVLAVIRGSAVSHNGFSGGLTSPSGRSQEKLIQSALENAGVKPSEIDYLEAHGTGTEFGDPIEMHAAGTVLAKGRPAEDPLLVGTVKPNIGHLEAAGGVSGLIKAVLSMHHRVIPRQIHFDEPSPHVPWKQLAVKMVTEQTPWPVRGERRVAGVTALGMSGTNAHVVLMSHDGVRQKEAGEDDEPSLIVLSAKSEERLSLAADRLADFIQDSQATLSDIGYSTAVGRKSFGHRVAVVANSKVDAVDRLRAEARATSEACSTSSKTAWLFGPGEGRLGTVCRTLYEREPVLREVVDTCAEFWAAQDRENFASAVIGGGGEVGLPEAFSVQVAIGKLLESWGLEPDVVLGLGEGELAAACLAGVLNFDDALRLVNEVWRREGNADEAELDRFEEACDRLDYFPTDRPLISCLSGKLVPLHRLLGGSYWRRHAEESFDVAECAAGLGEFGIDSVVCFGELTGKVAEMRSGLACAAEFASLGAAGDRPGLLSVVGQLFAAGANPDFAAVFSGESRRVQLPPTPFVRKRYWLTDVSKYTKATAALQ